MIRKITFLALILFFLACKKKNRNSCPNKDQECDNSLFTLINRTNDTVFYSIGTNIWEDTLLPGQQQSSNYGKVKVTYNEDCEMKRETMSSHMVSSNWGSWGYTIDHCDKRAAFEYDAPGVINLYDVTEY